MSAVGADYDHVHLAFVRRLVDLDFRRPKHQLLAVLVYIEIVRERGKVRRRLLVNLILYCGKVHRNLAPVSEAKGFNHMNDVQFGVQRIGDLSSSFRNMACIFGEVGGKKDSLDFGHSGVTNIQRGR